VTHSEGNSREEKEKERKHRMFNRVKAKIITIRERNKKITERVFFKF